MVTRRRGLIFSLAGKTDCSKETKSLVVKKVFISFSNFLKVWLTTPLKSRLKIFTSTVNAVTENL